MIVLAQFCIQKKYFCQLKLFGIEYKRAAKILKLDVFNLMKFPVAVIPFEKTAFLETWLIWSTTST